MRLPVDREVRERLDRLELPFNTYGVDPYGISKEYLGVWFSAVKFFFRTYFSVESRGIEHVPPRGRAMLIGNRGRIALPDGE